VFTPLHERRALPKITQMRAIEQRILKQLDVAIMNPTSKSTRWIIAVVSVFSLLVMAYIDYITGYELVFSAAYLIPVALCAWYFGRLAIWLMSIASGLASWFVDMLSGHTYAHFMIQYWNSFTCFLVSLLTGLLLHRLKHILKERQQINNDLQKALEELKRSTEEIMKLQNGLQVVCAWTKRIKVEEQWMTPDEFLTTQLHLKISHGMSPEASQEFEQDLKRRARALELTD
jgi:K+-sensing histidine kinase KdpD